MLSLIINALYHKKTCDPSQIVFVLFDYITTHLFKAIYNDNSFNKRSATRKGMLPLFDNSGAEVFKILSRLSNSVMSSLARFSPIPFIEQRSLKRTSLDLCL